MSKYHNKESNMSIYHTKDKCFILLDLVELF